MIDKNNNTPRSQNETSHSNMSSLPNTKEETAVNNVDWKEWLALNGSKLLLFARQQTRSQDRKSVV